jgi:hypothetical protein
LKGCKLRKERTEKLFNEKFSINCSWVNVNCEQTVLENIQRYCKKNNISKLNSKNIKSILTQLDIYLGSFYISPQNTNDIFGFNLENVHQSLSTLNKRAHSENDWAYSNTEFQKVYVLKYDGSIALTLVLYNDNWSDYLIGKIRTNSLYLKGNMCGDIFFLDDIEKGNIECLIT